MRFFDFKFLSLCEHHRTAFHPISEAVHERRPDRFLSTHGVHSSLPISALGRSLPGPSLRQRFFLLGPIPLPRLRSAHLSRKLARHRSLSAGSAIQTLSHGL